MTTATDWQSFGACVGLDPAGFIPDRSKFRLDAITERRAKATCATCRVRGECLAEALREGWCGIWGGTTEQERRAMRPRRVCPECGCRPCENPTMCSARAREDF